MSSSVLDREKTGPSTPDGPPSRRNWWGLLLLPALAMLGLLFVYPLGVMVSKSFTDVPSGAEWYENYRWFLSEPINRTILLRTLKVSVSVTVICLVLGYAYAYMMTVAKPRWRTVMAGVLLLSFWTGAIIRNFTWVALLQRGGVISELKADLGFGEAPILGTTTAVLIGMSQVLLPVMILPLYATMRGIDRRVVEAARGLGAGAPTAFFRIYLPLSLPGVLAGCLLTFVFALGFFLTPAMLGSPRDTLYSQLIDVQVHGLFLVGRGSAMSIGMLIVIVLLLAVAAKISGKAVGSLIAGREEGR
jgi:putative spermidine/putrescine transport system permease protein